MMKVFKKNLICSYEYGIQIYRCNVQQMCMYTCTDACIYVVEDLLTSMHITYFCSQLSYACTVLCFVFVLIKKKVARLILVPVDAEQ